MTRLVLAAGFGIVVGVLAGAALGLHAQEISPDVQAAADEAGVDPVSLLGAVYTTHLDPRAYLVSVGELAAPEPVCGWPICGPLGQRIYCIEGFESHHNGTAVNRSSGASGWLQWLPSTAHTWGVAIGDRWSEWQAAAHIAALGEPFFRSQWTTLQRGMC